jgi:Mn2+/Fe2+ NRAMP family transporter
MNRRCRLVFLLLVAFQAAHSAEEYATRLYEVFAPARFVSSLVSADAALGFVMINLALLAAGFFSYIVLARSSHRNASILAWLWIALELSNGLGHIARPLTSRRGYRGGRRPA